MKRCFYIRCASPAIVQELQILVGSRWPPSLFFHRPGHDLQVESELQAPILVVSLAAILYPGQFYLAEKAQKVG